MSLMEPVRRFVNIEQESRSKALTCLKDGITAMLEERIANVIHEERIARLRDMSEMHLLYSVERELDARGHGKSAARKAQAS